MTVPVGRANDLVSTAWGSEARIDVEAMCQWTALRAVQLNLARRSSGDPAVDWVSHSAHYVSQLGRPARALSLGCGFGTLERRLAATGLFAEIVGVDLAQGAVDGATRLAQEEGYTNLRYEVGDLNTVTFPEQAYDVVYAHASLHHVFQLERLFAEVKRTLTPDGLFVVYDYVGPSLMQHTREHLMLADDVLLTIPEQYRKNLRVGGVQHSCYRLSIDEFEASDPSEGVRAHEIPELLAGRFKIEYARQLGGTVQYLVLSDIAGNFATDDPEAKAHLHRVMALDDQLVDAGIIPSYHVYLVCRKSPDPLVRQTSNALLSPAARLSANRMGEGSWLLDWHSGGGPSEVWVSADGKPAELLLTGESGLRLVQARAGVAEGTPDGSGEAEVRAGAEHPSASEMPDEQDSAESVPVVPSERAALPRIVVTPDPVPPGSTTAEIAWEAEERVELRVSQEGDPTEQVVVDGTSGRLTVDWIDPSRVYIFRLYRPEEASPICELTTTRSVLERPYITVTPELVLPGTTHADIAWAADEVVDVRVSLDDEPEIWMTASDAGTLAIDWIQRDHHRYAFRLYRQGSEQLLCEAVARTGAADPVWLPPARVYRLLLRDAGRRELRTVSISHESSAVQQAAAATT